MKNLLNQSFLSYVYLLILGILSAFSLPPYNFFIINFITFSLFFIFIFKKKNKIFNKKEFFIYGWIFGFGYFLSSLYWISISLTFDENFKYLIPFSIILVPAFLSIFYGLVTYIFSIFNLKKLTSSFLLFSVIFGSIEFIRGYIFTGFPWNLISFSFSEINIFIQILSVIGTYSFNLICITLFTCPAIFFLKKTFKELFICFFYIIIAVGFLIFGIVKNNDFSTIETKKNEYLIRSISSNITLDRFYNENEEEKIIQELILLSKPDKNLPTIFLWPEGLVSLSKIDEIKNQTYLLSNVFDKDHKIFMGVTKIKKIDNKYKYFNSMAVFDNNFDLVDEYNKVKLVPFGEFIPFEKILGKVGLKTITNNYKSFSTGNERDVIKIKSNNKEIKFLPLICYEIIYSGEIIKNENFDYILNISEDGWFGRSIGPKQHFTHSIFRSIESGKYIIRSANNGISGIINPIGKVEKKIDFGKSGFIDFTESKSLDPTPFTKYGNNFFLFIILLYIFLIFSFNKIENE